MPRSCTPDIDQVFREQRLNNARKIRGDPANVFEKVFVEAGQIHRPLSLRRRYRQPFMIITPMPQRLCAFHAHNQDCVAKQAGFTPAARSRSSCLAKLLRKSTAPADKTGGALPRHLFRHWSCHQKTRNVMFQRVNGGADGTRSALPSV